MANDAYTEFLDKDNNIQRIVFAVALIRNGFNMQKINDIITTYDFADDLLDLQTELLYMKKINEYNAEWAQKEKDNINKLSKELTKDRKHDVGFRLEIMNIEKTIIEDLDYIIGNRSMPNIRNIKRLNTIKLIVDGRTYNEIIAIIS